MRLVCRLYEFVLQHTSICAKALRLKSWHKNLLVFSFSNRKLVWVENNIYRRYESWDFVEHFSVQHEQDGDAKQIQERHRTRRRVGNTPSRTSLEFERARCEAKKIAQNEAVCGQYTASDQAQGCTSKDIARGGVLPPPRTRLRAARARRDAKQNQERHRTRRRVGNTPSRTSLESERAR